MKILSITGKKRSGKDTVTSIIAKNRNVVYYKLAEEIKRSLEYGFQNLLAIHTSTKIGRISYSDIDGQTKFDREKILDVSDSEVFIVLNQALQYLRRLGLDHYGSLVLEEKIKAYEKGSWSLRTFMQRLGTDIVCEEIDKYFWVKQAIKFYSYSLGKGYKYLIIPDVRQEWEMETIRDLGGLIVHVNRPSLSNVKEDTHSTEKGLLQKENDIIIINDSDLESLQTKVNKTFKDL